MTTLQILKRARALIADEKNWTRDAYGYDAEGRMQTCPNQHSVCFCSVGAIAKASFTHPSDAERSDAIKPVLSAGGFDGVGELIKFNDSHTHSEVLDLFDRAIARAESEAA